MFIFEDMKLQIRRHSALWLVSWPNFIHIHPFIPVVHTTFYSRIFIRFLIKFIIHNSIWIKRRYCLYLHTSKILLATKLYAIFRVLCVAWSVCAMEENIPQEIAKMMLKANVQLVPKTSKGFILKRIWKFWGMEKKQS